MTADTPKFDIDYLKELADFMQESDIHEVECTKGEATIRLRRDTAPAVTSGFPSVALAATQTPAAAPEVVPAEAVPTEVVPAEKMITSPMVGTFYRAPSPEADVFVKEGDKVKKGQVICIIEAMKTMNQIEADKDGVIASFPAENATPVEFGSPLIILE